MPKVVVLGAGIGGIPAAFELRDLLGRSADIMVVSDCDYFHFVPSNPWVAVGWRRPEDIKVSLPDVFARKGIGFTSVGAKRLAPEENRILLGDGSTLYYDYLVIATGPKLAFDEVEGLGPQGHTHSICSVDHAGIASKEWEAFCGDPGPMVVGAVQAPPASARHMNTRFARSRTSAGAEFAIRRL